MPKPSSGSGTSVCFLFASCTVSFSVVPVFMAARSLSLKVIVTKLVSLGLAIVDRDQQGIRQAEPEGQLGLHRRGLGLRRIMNSQRDDRDELLPLVALDDLQHRI